MVMPHAEKSRSFKHSVKNTRPITRESIGRWFIQPLPFIFDLNSINFGSDDDGTLITV